MGKNKSPGVKRVVTKRQISRIKKQEKRQQIIKIIGSIVIAAVLVIVGLGVNKWYVDDIKPLKQTVVEVNGTRFDMQYYIDMLTYVSGEYYQFASYFTTYALENIEYYELIKRGAEELGITVTEKEITAEIEENDFANTQAARDMTRASLLIPKLEEYFGSQIAVSAEHSHVLAMFLESKAQVEDVKARIAAGETFGDIAAELSLNTTTKEDKGDLGWLPIGVIDNILGASVLDDLIGRVELNVLSEALDEDTTKEVGYWIITVQSTETVPGDETNEESRTAVVNAMLLGSEQEAEEVLAKLEAGEDFETLAKEYSQIWDETNGSKLEVKEGAFPSAFEAYALDPEVEIGAISGIIRDVEESTTGGYWLYEVTDRGIQGISEENMDILIHEKLSDWVESLDRTNIVESLTDEMR
ncbi:MAG: peptidylprolyl isomerase, partial [Dehalococcoidales bacterium]|nr:peptidylprolyl isomerase [Dehalococcoidales bacterium]